MPKISILRSRFDRGIRTSNTHILDNEMSARNATLKKKKTASRTRILGYRSLLHVACVRMKWTKLAEEKRKREKKKTRECEELCQTNLNIYIYPLRTDAQKSNWLNVKRNARNLNSVANVSHRSPNDTLQRQYFYAVSCPELNRTRMLLHRLARTESKEKNK